MTALGLRSADGILSRNDVYIQAYPVPKDFDPNAASSRASSKASRGSTGPMLPEPAKQTVLPPGDYTFELPELKLPDRAPGSFEINTCRYPRWHNHDYVHSHIRHPITVAYWSPPLPADESLLEVGITSRRPNRAFWGGARRCGCAHRFPSRRGCLRRSTRSRCSCSTRGATSTPIEGTLRHGP